MKGEQRLPAEVLQALREQSPEWEPLDRNLDLGEGRTVDLVALDPIGRVVLTVWVDADPDGAALTALDAFAFWTENRTALAAHWRAPGLRAELDPLLVLVSEELPKRLVQRLRALRPDSLRMFELRWIASDAGQAAYLVEAAATVEGREAPVDPRRPWTDGLSSELMQLATLAQKRIDRVDDELVRVRGEQSVRWQLDREHLCSLYAHDGRLEGRIESDGPARPLTSEEEADRFVDEVLGRYIGLLEQRIGSNGTDASAPESPLLQALEPDVLLTPEELEAFRQPG